MHLAHTDHPLELRTVFGFHSADAFISEYFNQVPLSLFLLRKLGVVVDLRCVGVELIRGGRRYPAVGSHTNQLNSLLRYRRYQCCLWHLFLSFLGWGGCAYILCATSLVTHIISIEPHKSREFSLVFQTFLQCSHVLVINWEHPQSGLLCGR